MTIIRPDSLPRLWWLFPWSIARQLHKNATALKAYGDRADRAIEMQIRIIDNKDQDIQTLQARVRSQDAIILASVSR
jgi:putative NADPH-quinone reductase